MRSLLTLHCAVSFVEFSGSVRSLGALKDTVVLVSFCGEVYYFFELFLSFCLFLAGLRKKTSVLSLHSMPISQMLAGSSSCSLMGNVISFKSLARKDTSNLTIIRLAQTWRSAVWRVCFKKTKKKSTNLSIVRRHSYLSLIHYSAECGFPATTSCCNIDEKQRIDFTGCWIPTLKKERG